MATRGRSCDLSPSQSPAALGIDYLRVVQPRRQLGYCEQAFASRHFDRNAPYGLRCCLTNRQARAASTAKFPRLLPYPQGVTSAIGRARSALLGVNSNRQGKVLVYGVGPGGWWVSVFRSSATQPGSRFSKRTNFEVRIRVRPIIYYMSPGTISPLSLLHKYTIFIDVVCHVMFHDMMYTIYRTYSQPIMCSGIICVPGSHLSACCINILVL